MKPEKPNPAGTGGAWSDLLRGASLQLNSPFNDHRQACLALLTSGAALTRKAGQFLGGEAVSPGPLSEKQLAWQAVEARWLAATDDERRAWVNCAPRASRTMRCLGRGGTC
jgi:hypothetical protein